MTRITHTSDLSADYAAGLRTCADLPSLRAFVRGWRELAPDAAEAVGAMTDDDWPSYQKGLKKESRGKYAGDAWAERYGAILMPALLLRVSMIAGCPTRMSLI